MKDEFYVTKRDDTKELADINKIHRVVQWACEGVAGVSASAIEAQAKMKLFNGIRTSDLHRALVDAAHELVALGEYNYDLPAGRLLAYDVRKKAYGQFQVPHILNILEQNIRQGWYDPELIDLYTNEQWNQINDWIVHDRDFTIRIAGMKEWTQKYIVKNRVTGEFKETPQISYMLVAAIRMHKYVKDGFEPLSIVKDDYDSLSQYDQTIPTPILAGLRTPTRQFASCTVIECGDSLNSITATADAVVKYASRKAGLGIGLYNLRAEKRPVRGGEATTTGPIPFGQFFQSSVLSCSQGAIRKGSATFYHNIWHRDVEQLLVLKNSKGTEETRIRHSDHAFNFNRYLWRRMVEGKDMYLFSPEEVPDLQEAFFADQDLFAKLYEKYGKSSKIKSKLVVSAAAIRDLFITERTGTSRVYVNNVDNANEQGPFIASLAPVRQSNLCLSGNTKVRVVVDGKVMTLRLDALNSLMAEEDRPFILVESYNVQTGHVEMKPVLKSAKTGVDRSVVRVLADCAPKGVVCTPDHPVYTVNRGYIEAQDLLSDDVLVVDGTAQHNQNVRVEYLEQTIDVFDITVQDNHNFFADGILVHNCTEIQLPTIPLQFFDDPSGLISLCTLSNSNWGNIKSPKQLEKTCKLMVYGLDSILDYQDYPLQAARNSTNWYRSLGIGINSLAQFLAKRGLKYGTKECLEVIDEYMEAQTYYLMKYSIELAKRYGPCEKFNHTKYSQGAVPGDHRAKAVDELIPHVERMDWDSIRADLLKYGARNATLGAIPPAETSSKLANLTNGVEAPRGLVVSKDGSYIVVPDVDKLKNKYEMAWDVDVEAYIKTMAVLQKRLCQSISANTTYDPSKYPGGMIPGTLIFRHLLLGVKYGLKNFYYNNNVKDTMEDPTDDPSKAIQQIHEGSGDVACNACEL